MAWARIAAAIALLAVACLPASVTEPRVSPSPSRAGESELDAARRLYAPDVTAALLSARATAPSGFDACAEREIGAERLARLRGASEPVSGRDNDAAALCLARLGVPATGLVRSSASASIRVERVSSEYPTAPGGGRTGIFRTGQPADLMLSGFDFDHAGGPLAFNHPAGIASDGQHLFLADTFNNRVLIWNEPPTGNVPPDVVLGQADFETNHPGSGRSELNWPMAVATDGVRLLVADTLNDRILVWERVPTRNATPADLALRGTGIRRPGARGAVVWPWGVWTDGERLVVSSTGGGQVLIWNRFPIRDDAPDIVLTGGGLMGTPRQVTSDGRSLVVGDHNARVPASTERGAFVWKSFPTREDQPFDTYLSRAPWPRGAFGADGRLWLMARTLSVWDWPLAGAAPAPALELAVSPCEGPGDYESVALVGTRLFLSCGNGNKVVVFDTLPTRRDARPSFAIGAPDLDTNTLHTRYVVQNGVPVSNGVSLFVGSDFDRKLYVWRRLPDRSGALPDVVYSLPDSGPWDVALWGSTLALAGGDAVYLWKTPPLAGELPDLVFRQTVGSVRVRELRGVALDARYFYLADATANAVYVWEGVPRDGEVPKYTLTLPQPRRLHSDGRYLLVTTTFEHAVQVFAIAALSSSSRPIRIGGVGRLNLPESAVLAGDHLFVADTANNRVLVWHDLAEALAGRWPPDAVLGQPDLDTRVAAIGRDRLFFPGAVYYDGTYLWVGEFKFSDRLLRFSPAP
jgi:hypothetical protein